MIEISPNILYVALAVLLISTIVLFVLVIKMHFKMKKFLIDVDSKNISDSLSRVLKTLSDLESFRIEMEKYLTSVEKRLRRSVQSVQTVRFNPFKGEGAGGNQSFATAFLNEEGNGVVISSLYSREHVSIFAKPLRNSASEHEMSEEEKEVLDKAKNGLK
ncbi:MAG: DUF4446 family protein [Candidatus Paceibacterota bacterium]|jgi:hypothetical protein